MVPLQYLPYVGDVVLWLFITFCKRQGEESFKVQLISYEEDQFDWARAGHTDFHPFTLDGLDEVLKQIGDAPVYFTVDLDVMDPSVFPGTGTPEPGGIDFLTAMRGVTKVCESVNLIGCDVNELCPPCDPTGASTAAACKIIREMLIAIGNRQD